MSGTINPVTNLCIPVTEALKFFLVVGDLVPPTSVHLPFPLPNPLLRTPPQCKNKKLCPSIQRILKGSIPSTNGILVLTGCFLHKSALQTLCSRLQSTDRTTAKTQATQQRTPALHTLPQPMCQLMACSIHSENCLRLYILCLLYEKRSYVTDDRLLTEP